MKSSTAVSKSLSNLQRVFDVTADKLRKIPGAFDQALDVTDVLIPDWPDSGVLWMRLDRDDDEPRLAVYDTQGFHRWVDEYPVDQRMELAKLLPDLIEAVKAGLDDVAKEVDEIVGKIEQALAD